jgi:hypothetical protein
LLGKFQSQEKDEFLIKKEATNTLWEQERRLLSGK